MEDVEEKNIRIENKKNQLFKSIQATISKTLQ